MISDVVIFDFSGMVRKGNAETVQSFGQLGIRGDIFALPQVQCPLIPAHGKSPYAIRSIVSFRRMGHGLGLAPKHILTQTDYN